MEVLKRGQLKMQQMAFMILAVFLLFVLVGVFFVSFYSGQIKEKAEIIKKNKAIGIAGLLANSPEFSCGSQCVDADRAMILRDKEIYDELWPVRSIRIYTIYPKKPIVECTAESYPNCNYFSILNKSEEVKTVESFISLCKRQGEEILNCEIGRFVVGY
ncbi:MAG: hypothetical protein AABX75_02700 [Nanoarchaeota archaeon]